MKAIAFTFLGFFCAIQLSAQNPVHSWNFSGSTFDGVGQLDGALIGTPVLETDRDGNANSAYRFLRGEGDAIVLNGSQDDLGFIANSGVFTISLFAKIETFGQRTTLLSSSCGTGQGFLLERYSSGMLSYGVYGTPGTGSGLGTGNIEINDNSWHHIGLVGDGATWQFYLDGQAVGAAKTFSQSNLTTGNDTGPTFIGSCPTSARMDGVLDDIQIFDVALDAPQMLSLANGSAVVTPPAPVPDSGEWTKVSDNIYYNTGKVSIGTEYVNAGYQLAVSGDILTEGLTIKTYANWPDYVFDPDYLLQPLSYVKAYIAKNGHLPGVPSAAMVDKNGYDLEEMLAIQQKKIEELTLHLINQDETIKTLIKELKTLKEQVIKSKGG